MSLPDLRAELSALLPPQARVKRARGAGEAYAVPAECASPAALNALGWRVREERDVWLLIPSDAMLARFEAAAGDENLDFFAASLLRLRGRAADPGAAALFAEGLKLREAPQAAALRAYELRVRRLAAVNLRAGSGGALACALLRPDAQ